MRSVNAKMKKVIAALNEIADAELSPTKRKERKPRKEPKWARELRERLEARKRADLYAQKAGRFA